MLKSILTNPTFLSVINGQLRHVLTTLGGSLATAGYIESSAVSGLVGAAMVIMGAVLSAISKKAA